MVFALQRLPEEALCTLSPLVSLSIMLRWVRGAVCVGGFGGKSPPLQAVLDSDQPP
jgi:hypothetical protein